LNHEVSELIWVPLGDLETNRYASSIEYRHGKKLLTFPAWDIDGRIVWGLTYRILRQLLDAIYRPEAGSVPLVLPGPTV
jgi:hypothetical protein